MEERSKIQTHSASYIWHLFRMRLWTLRYIQCGFCYLYFNYKPLVVTWSDGKKTICCGRLCRRKIKSVMKLKEVEG